MTPPSSLTKSAMIVLGHLSNGGPMTPKQIINECGLAARTVTYALRDLINLNLARKVPNLHDMRKPLYRIDREKVREIERNIETWRAATRSMIR
ncbi:MAG: helix-turn-helix domain-containing protein [Candidatus Thorarchaeota archaeon]